MIVYLKLTFIKLRQASDPAILSIMNQNVAFSRKFIVCLLLLLNVSKAHAGILDINVVGGTFHPHTVESRRVAIMPRRLDKRAKWVITPGLLVGYDFRASDKKRGKSLYAVLGYNRDCYDWPFYTLGCGIRYRYDFSKRYTFRCNVLGAIVFTKQNGLCEDIWPPLNPFENKLPFMEHTRLVLLPYISMGLHYQLSDTEALGLECIFSVYTWICSVVFSHVFPKRKGDAQVSR